MLEKIRLIVESSLFQNLALGMIIAYSVLIGVSLYFPENALLEILDWSILGFFVVEILLRMIAVWSLRNFFFDGWNTFDFVLVFSTIVPGVGTSFAAARVLRVLRVMRLVKSVPELRLIVSTLLNSLKSMVYVALLAGILFYIYGVIGTVIFAEISPQFFGTLHRSILTLFQIITLDGWVEVMESVSRVGLVSRLYFISFVSLGTFIVLSLIVAVIVDNVQSAKEGKNK